jgi:hypothetical protein
MAAQSRRQLDRERRLRTRLARLPGEVDRVASQPAGTSMGSPRAPVLPGGGEKLPSGTRVYMESALGHDFSKVRVHADDRAAAVAQSRGARALTSGHDIVFGAGHFQPDTASGRQLLAHELAHVAQQNRESGRPVSAATAEQEARAAALSVSRGDVAGVYGSVPAGVQRQPETATEAPVIREVVTTYGIFEVYPDDFIGPLPVADPTQGPWAIRETPFAQLQIAIDSIEGGAAGITIEEDGSFKAVVLLDLAWLMTQSAGQELINDIVASGKQLTIKKTDEGNMAPPDSWDGVFLNEDGSPGAGNDVTIHYNPVNWNPYGGAEEWMTRPPAIALAHEMIHAWTAMTGTMARDDPHAAVRPLEEQATGLGAYEDALHTENRFRRAFGLPLRPEY